MLTELIKSELHEEQLFSGKEFKLFPKISEREKWGKLPAAVKSAVIKKGEEYLGYEWPMLPAVRYMDFTANGNRSIYEGLYFSRRNALSALVTAECAEGEGRFLNDIINGIWAICEESSWTVPAHNNAPGKLTNPLPDITEPVIDLFSAETSALISLTYYLLKDVLDQRSSLIAERMVIEVKRRVLDPFLEIDDFWWMGRSGRINNWNPWCDSNCIISILFLEDDRSRIESGLLKAMVILDRFIATYRPDGGCDEGPNYWNVAGGSMFDCLELLYEASEGKINIYDNKLTGEIGRYIYRVHVSGKYYINFADANAKVTPPGELLYRYGKRIGDEALCSFGLSLDSDIDSKTAHFNQYSLLRRLYALFDDEWLNSSAILPDYPRDIYLEGIQVMASRERRGTDKGLYIAAKGGHNDESHNHNDVGQFIVFYDGRPVIIDAGVGEYTAKTFSDRRYEIWTMQSAYHNLPTINRIQQHCGMEYKASDICYDAKDGRVEFSLNLKTAYPGEAGIVSWLRSFRLNRTEEAFIEVSDSFVLEKETADLSLSLMTLYKPELREGRLYIRDAGGTGVEVGYDSAAFETEIESIKIDDKRMFASWGGMLYRTVLKCKSPTAQGKWKLTFCGVKNGLSV